MDRCAIKVTIVSFILHCNYNFNCNSETTMPKTSWKALKTADSAFSNILWMFLLKFNYTDFGGQTGSSMQDQMLRLPGH